MPLDGTIGGLVGMLDVLRIECPTCNRTGRYNVERLVAEVGPDYRLTDWLHEQTLNCPQKNQEGRHASLRAHMPDLSRLSQRE